jgi:KDO2-lipid IV(A) lauroyltransferase
MRLLKNITVYLCLAVLWLLVKLLPYGSQMRLGALLGSTLYVVMRARREVARINIGLCFPALSPTDRHELLRENFRNLGRGVFETGIAWYGSGRFVSRLVTVQGVANLDGPKASGNGALLVGGHFTTLDITCRALGTAIDFDVSYRPFGIAPLDAHVIHGRERSAGIAIPKDNFRLLLQRLKQNRLIWIAVDQADTSKGSVDARFFGRMAPSFSSVARIASNHGCAVVPLFFKRREDGKGYIVRIEEPLQHFPSGDPVADAERLNGVVERHVGEIPAQYYWIHRRFKADPGLYSRA